MFRSTLTPSHLCRSAYFLLLMSLLLVAGPRPWTVQAQAEERCCIVSMVALLTDERYEGNYTALCFCNEVPGQIIPVSPYLTVYEQYRLVYDCLEAPCDNECGAMVPETGWLPTGWGEDLIERCVEALGGDCTIALPGRYFIPDEEEVQCPEAE